jgi:alginate O-acetyltransferase complex protein AlgI
LLKARYRIYFLLLASLLFYAWGEPLYVLVMLLSIAINYTFGLLIHVSTAKNNRMMKLQAAHISRILLFIAVICNLGILFYFKYLDFTLYTIDRFFHTGFIAHNIVMPIGISFFTFQGMSYVIDLYRGKVSVQKNPAYTAFYISFFPQLIAGPIVRYIDIEKQIYSRDVSIEKFVSGAKRFIIGLSKKVIIANNIGFTVDQIFCIPANEHSIPVAWLGAICYAFQIFFDFSGYSDMAIGLGKMFGFDFPKNFNLPYCAKTVTEFWRRWHISLSSWFKDYVYIPLGGNRKGNVYVNLLVVFAVTGLWHGAALQFIVWGLWHGFFLVVERLFGIREENRKSIVPLRCIATLLVVAIGWVFFRSPGLRYALKYIGVMFGMLKSENTGFSVGFFMNQKVIAALVLAVIASTPLPRFINLKCRRCAYYKYFSYVITLVLLFISIIFVVSSSYNPFIYFRF